MTNFDMPNNVCSKKNSLKLVPGLADLGVPYGDGDGKLKGLDDQKSA